MSYKLLNAGFELIVYNRSQEKVNQICDSGARKANSLADLTREADVVLACLPDIDTVESLFLGPHGIINSSKPGQILVDHSTVGIKTSKACAEAALRQGAMFLDAPISGGTERAQSGDLTIMAGGLKEAYDSVVQVFNAMGTTVRHIGPTGTGTTVKLINQLLVGIHSLAAAEAILMGAKSGADPNMVYEVVNSGWGQSFMLSRNAPVMIDRDFNGDRTQIRVFLKDLVLANELAEDLGLSSPGAKLARDLLQRTNDAGHGDLDGAAIVLPLEQDAQFEITRIEMAE
jgi:3-hydroxyisobutyrate dehydrogenase-like beta-hydroxyacid dehydrogenase